jgi:hypothetical protein
LAPALPISNVRHLLATILATIAILELLSVYSFRFKQAWQLKVLIRFMKGKRLAIKWLKEGILEG